MYYYQVKIHIDKEIVNEWLEWMKLVHIRNVLATELFDYAEILKLSDEYEDKSSYMVQYKCPARENYIKYITLHSEKLREEHTSKFSGRFLASRDFMEVIAQINI